MNNEKQVMAAIINNKQIDSRTKAEQLFALLLNSQWLTDPKLILDMISRMIDTYNGTPCRHGPLPTLTHSLAVMQLVAVHGSEYDCLNSDTICSALGHDLLDDDKFSYEDIGQMFGKNTAHIIVSLSDHNKKLDDDNQFQRLNTWRTRKAMYLKGMEERLNQSWAKSMLVIACADKVDNCRRLTLEAKQYRKNIWNKEILPKDWLWYYQISIDFFNKHLDGSLSGLLAKDYQLMVKAFKLIK
ncbi:MAG: hypothetical protein V1765_00805 [bacterium]